MLRFINQSCPNVTTVVSFIVIKLRYTNIKDFILFQQSIFVEFVREKSESLSSSKHILTTKLYLVTTIYNKYT